MAKNEVILGSGKLYIVDFDAESGIPENTQFETEQNSVGSIKGGASLSYEGEVYEVIDDAGFVLQRFVSKEEVLFKSGILSWDLKNLERLSMTGKVIEDEGKRILKIGGQTDELKKYALRFVHTLKSGKKIRVTLIATANSGFELTFNPEEETVLDAEFKALQASESDMTLVTIEQEIDA